MSSSLRIARRTLGAGVVTALLLAGASPAWSQNDDPNREATREKVRSALRQIGPRINVSFQQSQANPFNFSGSMTAGLEDAESMEIIVMVGKNDILTVRVFPHVNGGYVNVDKAANGTGLMRKLLANNAGDFFHWGMDDVYDVFAEFTFTLESGFPEESLDVVLRSVELLDKKVGEMGLLIGR